MHEVDLSSSSLHADSTPALSLSHCVVADLNRSTSDNSESESDVAAVAVAASVSDSLSVAESASVSVSVSGVQLGAATSHMPQHQDKQRQDVSGPSHLAIETLPQQQHTMQDESAQDHRQPCLNANANDDNVKMQDECKHDENVDNDVALTTRTPTTHAHATMVIHSSSSHPSPHPQQVIANAETTIVNEAADTVMDEQQTGGDNANVTNKQQEDEVPIARRLRRRTTVSSKMQHGQMQSVADSMFAAESTSATAVPASAPSTSSFPPAFVLAAYLATLPPLQTVYHPLSMPLSMPLPATSAGIQQRQSTLTQEQQPTPGQRRRIQRMSVSDLRSECESLHAQVAALHRQLEFARSEQYQWISKKRILAWEDTAQLTSIQQLKSAWTMSPNSTQRPLQPHIGKMMPN